MKTILPPAPNGHLNLTRQGLRLFLFALSAKRNKKRFSANFAPLMSAANGR
jgi:hypothetical protein